MARSDTRDEVKRNRKKNYHKKKPAFIGERGQNGLRL